jgi:hypothetical protein
MTWSEGFETGIVEMGQRAFVGWVGQQILHPPFGAFGMTRGFGEYGEEKQFGQE